VQKRSGRLTTKLSGAALPTTPRSGAEE